MPKKEVENDQRSSLLSVCTVYSDISVRKLGIITVLEQTVIGQPKLQLVSNGEK